MPGRSFIDRRAFSLPRRSTAWISRVSGVSNGYEAECRARVRTRAIGRRTPRASFFGRDIAELLQEGMRAGSGPESPARPAAGCPGLSAFVEQFATWPSRGGRAIENVRRHQGPPE